MDKSIIEKCEKLSSEAKITFPEVVKALLGAGVESYCVDLLKKRNTYYGTNGEVVEVPLSLTQFAPVAETFNADAVRDAIKRSQRQELIFPAFVVEIMKAGTYGYVAYLVGQRVVYLGRKGDMHVEHFPQKK